VSSSLSVSPSCHGPFRRVTLKFGERWGFRDVGDVGGLPLLVALFSVYGFALTPVFNTVTRTMEAEADAFGLNAARTTGWRRAGGAASGEYRKMQPGALEEAIFFDHPSGWNRIHRAMLWKAENFSAADIAAYDALHRPPRCQQVSTRYRVRESLLCHF